MHTLVTCAESGACTTAFVRRNRWLCDLCEQVCTAPFQWANQLLRHAACDQLHSVVWLLYVAQLPIMFYAEPLLLHYGNAGKGACIAAASAGIAIGLTATAWILNNFSAFFLVPHCAWSIILAFYFASLLIHNNIRLKIRKRVGFLLFSASTIPSLQAGSQWTLPRSAPATPKTPKKQQSPQVQRAMTTAAAQERWNTTLTAALDTTVISAPQKQLVQNYPPPLPGTPPMNVKMRRQLAAELPARATGR